MFYVLYKNPTSQIIIGDSDLSNTNEVLPVTLCGQDYVGEYGQAFQNNLYYLLENYNSGDTVPIPVAGMLWYDDKNYSPPILKIYTTENKWKKIEFLIDDSGVIEFTGSRYVGNQLTATLKDINNPTNISWAWFLNNTAFAQDGVVLDEISSTIITTGSGTYKAIATYDDDFNQGTSANNIVTIDDLAVDSPGALDITGSMVVGSPITATLIDLDTPVRVKWTWTDENQSLVTSTNKGLTSEITPDKAGVYTVLVEYYDAVNTVNPVTLQGTATVGAAVDDNIGYVTITGDAIINTPLTATLHEDDAIIGDVLWEWTQDTTALPAVPDTGKTSEITPTVPGLYIARAIYKDATHIDPPNSPQAQVEVTEFATTTRVTTRYVPTTTIATNHGSDCCCCCCCCCCDETCPNGGTTLPTTTNAYTTSTTTYNPGSTTSTTTRIGSTTSTTTRTASSTSSTTRAASSTSSTTRAASTSTTTAGPSGPTSSTTTRTGSTSTTTIGPGGPTSSTTITAGGSTTTTTVNPGGGSTTTTTSTPGGSSTTTTANPNGGGTSSTTRPSSSSTTVATTSPTGSGSDIIGYVKIFNHLFPNIPYVTTVQQIDAVLYEWNFEIEFETSWSWYLRSKIAGQPDTLVHTSKSNISNGPSNYTSPVTGFVYAIAEYTDYYGHNIAQSDDIEVVANIPTTYTTKALVDAVATAKLVNQIRPASPVATTAEKMGSILYELDLFTEFVVTWKWYWRATQASTSKTLVYTSSTTKSNGPSFYTSPNTGWVYVVASYTDYFGFHTVQTNDMEVVLATSTTTTTRKPTTSTTTKTPTTATPPASTANPNPLQWAGASIILMNDLEPNSHDSATIGATITPNVIFGPGMGNPKIVKWEWYFDNVLFNTTTPANPNQLVDHWLSDRLGNLQVDITWTGNPINTTSVNTYKTSSVVMNIHAATTSPTVATSSTTTKPTTTVKPTTTTTKPTTTTTRPDTLGVATITGIETNVLPNGDKTAIMGKKLTAVLTDPDTPTSISYQWKTGTGANIVGATSAAYTPTGAGTYYVSITYRDKFHTTSSVTVDSYKVVIAADTLGAVVVTGYSVDSVTNEKYCYRGDTLSASVTDPDGINAGSVAWYWPKYYTVPNSTGLAAPTATSTDKLSCTWVVAASAATVGGKVYVTARANYKDPYHPVLTAVVESEQITVRNPITTTTTTKATTTTTKKPTTTTTTKPTTTTTTKKTTTTTTKATSTTKATTAKPTSTTKATTATPGTIKPTTKVTTKPPVYATSRPPPLEPGPTPAEIILTASSDLNNHDSGFVGDTVTSQLDATLHVSNPKNFTIVWKLRGAVVKTVPNQANANSSYKPLQSGTLTADVSFTGFEGTIGDQTEYQYNAVGTMEISDKPTTQPPTTAPIPVQHTATVLLTSDLSPNNHSTALATISKISGYVAWGNGVSNPYGYKLEWLLDTGDGQGFQVVRTVNNSSDPTYTPSAAGTLKMHATFYGYETAYGSTTSSLFFYDSTSATMTVTMPNIPIITQSGSTMTATLQGATGTLTYNWVDASSGPLWQSTWPWVFTGAVYNTTTASAVGGAKLPVAGRSYAVHTTYQGVVLSSAVFTFK